MRDANAQRQQFRRVQEWLFAVLRFAITLEQIDRAAVLGVAAELDRRGSASAGSGFTFFVRTSVKLCDAIIAKDDPEAIATLRVHLRKIEHQTLRRAFEAVLDIESFPKKHHSPVIRSRENLWKGLSAR